MPTWREEGNPSATHVVEYLTEYEQRYDLPVHRSVTARDVQAAPDRSGFATDTDRGTWTSRVVISATGSWGRPFMPWLPGAADFAGRQLHTVDYRTASEFTGQEVVVVGGGNSGAQIAADLIPSAASVRWVTSRPPRFLPDEVDGRALFELATRRVQALSSNEDTDAGVGSLGDIVAVPPVRRARDAGLLTAEPMFSRFTADGVQWPDGGTARADTVLWCTGFRPDLRHLRGLQLTQEGRVPRTDPRLPSRSVDHPGLFFLGYGDWCGPASATLIGVGAPARSTVAAATQHLQTHTP